MPAIVSPGGNLVHFVAVSTLDADPIAADFVIDADAAPKRCPTAGCAVSTTSRSGLGQRPLDSWVLFRRAVLGLEPGDSLELADPFGLVRSVGVADASAAFAVVLNTSSSE
jgi:4-hydroxyphenylpyruvate dioxygenase